MAGRIKHAALAGKKDGGDNSIWRQLSYNKMAVLGMIILLLEILAVILAPVISPYGYNKIDMTAALQGPSFAHICGTDDMGRDIFSRLLYGGRYSISMGILAVSFSTIMGMAVGSVAGYFGGNVDNLIMRFLDIVESLPGMVLVVVLATMLGPGYINTILALAITGIPGSARMIRAQMLQVRENEFIEAAQSINCSKLRIIVDHLIPNSMSPLIVSATMGVASTIISAASLSFIGLGVQPPMPEWGAMLSSSRMFMRGFPHMVIFPGIAIALTVLSLNLMGDGLRDALDPKLKR